MSVSQFLDLVATMCLAGLAALALLVVGPSLPALLLALPLILLLPGYVIVSALYPARGPDGIGSVARFALSVALSIAVTPAVAFAANFTVGVYPRPVVVGVAAITIAIGFIAIGQRASVDPDDRAAPAPLARTGTISERYFRGTRSLRSTAPLEATSKTGVFLNLVVVGAILVFAASVGFAALVPQGEGVTETYLATTSDGNATIVQDPGSLTQAERQSLVAVVENQEGREMQYTVVFAAQDVTRTDQGVRVDDERVLEKQTNTVAPGESWQVDVPANDGERLVVWVFHGKANGDPDYRLVLQGS